MPKLLVLAVTAALVLAGCLSDEAIDSGGTEDAGADPQEPSVSATTGAIRGTVGSELLEPVGGAQVILFTADRTEVLQEAATARDGVFTFNGLAPGAYVLQARHSSYQTTVQGAHVEAGKVTSVDFRLKLLPTTDPYMVEEDIVGLLEWAYWYQVEVPTQGCVSTPVGPSTCSGSRSAYSQNFRGLIEDVVDNETKTILIEVAWQPAGVLGEYLQLHAYCKEGTFQSSGAGNRTHPCYQVSEHMTSPMTLRIDESHWIENDYSPLGTWQWHIHSGYGMLGTYPLAGIDVGAAYGQPYVVHISIFQRAAAPGDFSRIPDG